MKYNKTQLNKNLILSRFEINNIKSEYSDKFNNLSLKKLVKSIKNDNYELEVKSFDIKYIYSYGGSVCYDPPKYSV